METAAPSTTFQCMKESHGDVAHFAILSFPLVGTYFNHHSRLLHAVSRIMESQYEHAMCRIFAKRAVPGTGCPFALEKDLSSYVNKEPCLLFYGMALILVHANVGAKHVATARSSSNDLPTSSCHCKAGQQTNQKPDSNTA